MLQDGTEMRTAVTVKRDETYAWTKLLTAAAQQDTDVMRGKKTQKCRPSKTYVPAVEILNQERKTHLALLTPYCIFHTKFHYLTKGKEKGRRNLNRNRDHIETSSASNIPTSRYSRTLLVNSSRLQTPLSSNQKKQSKITKPLHLSAKLVKWSHFLSLHSHMHR